MFESTECMFVCVCLLHAIGFVEYYFQATFFALYNECWTAVTSGAIFMTFTYQDSFSFLNAIRILYLSFQRGLFVYKLRKLSLKGPRCG